MFVKRKKKEKLSAPSRESGCVNAPKKTIYDILGIGGEVLSREPKIVVTGDYLIEIYNHKGIIGLTDTEIQVNTKKFIYTIYGVNLMISAVTDEELVVTGNLIRFEKL